MHAARALLDAGRQAIRVSAFREALSLFDRGLALLARVESRPMRRLRRSGAQIERLLQIARMVPQRALRGSTGAKFEDTPVQVAETLAGDLDDRTRLAALAAEAGRLSGTGQFTQILDIAQRMLDLATRCGDDAFEAMAHFAFGLSYHSLGEPQKADGYFEWVLARHRPGRWAELRALVGFDLLSESLAFSAINKLALGYLDEALARSTRAVSAAQALGDHVGLACASAVGSLTLFLLRSDPRALQERAELVFPALREAWFRLVAALRGGLPGLADGHARRAGRRHRARAERVCRVAGHRHAARIGWPRHRPGRRVPGGGRPAAGGERAPLRIAAAPTFSPRAWHGSTPSCRPRARPGNATGPSYTACAGNCCWRVTGSPRRTRRWRASNGPWSLGGRRARSPGSCARR